MCEKEKESLFEKEGQDFLWFEKFKILKRDAIENPDKALRKCIESAYLDFNRTLRFKKDVDKDQKKSWREECVEAISTGINNILGDEPSEFGSNHRTICGDLCEKANQSDSPLRVDPKFVFTIGHAQKWVNMTLKYMLIMNIWNMDDLAPKLHVPIDSYILRYVSRPKKYDDNICEESLNIFKNINDYKIKIDSKEYKWSQISWSKINKRKDYDFIQEQLKKLSEEEDTIPIVWENSAWLKVAAKDDEPKTNET